MKEDTPTMAREFCMFQDMDDVKVYNTSKANTPLEKSNMELYNLANLMRITKPIGRGLLIGAGTVAVNGFFGGDTSLETYSLGMKLGAGIETAQYMTQLAKQYFKND